MILSDPKDLHLSDEKLRDLLAKIEGECYIPPIKRLEKQLEEKE